MIDLSSLVTGSAAGVVQLESLAGLGVFVIGYALVCLCVVMSCREKGVKSYFEKVGEELVLNHLGRGLSAFVMMWCLVYALVDS